ncbi:MAG: hypothetical protein MJK15_11565 [Colwellia sp.]|nr:hypothetical protein [Colwellia sp.]
MHGLTPYKFPNKSTSKILNQVLNQMNKYAIAQWQESGCAQLPVASVIKSPIILLIENYADEDVMTIFKAMLNLGHPIK